MRKPSYTLALFGFFLVTAILIFPQVAKAQKLVVGWSAVSELNAPYWVIKDAGFAKHERESIQKTVAAFEKVLGQKPTGYLSPGHASTPHTLELVAEAGFVWWADPLNSDNPYTVESNGRKVVVVPYNVPGCNDYSTYGAGRTPRDLLQIMKDQFDYLYWEGEQGAPKFFAFNLHPFISGVPFRAKIIDEFIRYAKGFAKVWFARRLEIANWCLERGY